MSFVAFFHHCSCGAFLLRHGSYASMGGCSLICFLFFFSFFLVFHSHTLSYNFYNMLDESFGFIFIKNLPESMLVEE